MSAKILVIGRQVRPIVLSAKCAGYEVYAVSYFDCVDQRAGCALSRTFMHDHTGDDVTLEPLKIKDKFQDYMMESAAAILEEIEIDFIVPKMNSPLINKLNKYSPVLGSDPKKIERANNKYEIYKLAKKLGIPTPETVRIKNKDDAISRFIEFKDNWKGGAVIKPARGAHGAGIVKINQVADIPEIPLEFSDRYLMQEYIPGIPGNISMLSAGDETSGIYLSEQIIADPFLGAPSGFEYCGNIGPARIKNLQVIESIKSSFSKIIKELGLVGNVGGDFVVNDNNFYLIEINPRFQGSQDVVQTTTGINLVSGHLKAFGGNLIEIPRADSYAVSMTAFARADVMVFKKYKNDGSIMDIPFLNSRVDFRAPVATALSVGSDRDTAIKRGKEIVRSIYRGVRIAD